MLKKIDNFGKNILNLVNKNLSLSLVMSKQQEKMIICDIDAFQNFSKNILWWKCPILREKFTEIVKYFKNHVILSIAWK